MEEQYFQSSNKVKRTNTFPSFFCCHVIDFDAWVNNKIICTIFPSKWSPFITTDFCWRSQSYWKQLQNPFFDSSLRWFLAVAMISSKCLNHCPVKRLPQSLLLLMWEDCWIYSMSAILNSSDATCTSQKQTAFAVGRKIARSCHLWSDVKDASKSR